MARMQFNSPPGWPKQDLDWKPDSNWAPDSSWPPAPTGWVFWTVSVETSVDAPSGPLLQVSGEKLPALEPSEPTALLQEVQEVAAEISANQDLDTTKMGDDELSSKVDLPGLRAEAAELEALILSRRNELEQSEASAAKCVEIAATLVELNDALLLQQVGIYEYHHPLENAQAFKKSLDELNERIHSSIRSGNAILASDRFAFNNSLAQGKKMISDFSKLMLRAYNAEADSCVRSIRAGTSAAAAKRLVSARDTIAKLGQMMEMRVAGEYHDLRIEEIKLTSDYFMKLQEEKEDAREERNRLREERKVELEIAAEREKLLKERTHYENTIESLAAQGKHDEASELKTKLASIVEAIAQNDFRATNIRAGYVYVISNIGAFGPNVVKIGLTRRLEPMDRIRELSDASVPFPFDVHAIYFSDDAVTLENQLHEEYSSRRVNQVNHRREHFFATPEMVRLSLSQRVGNLLEFQEIPDATQYNLSRSQWPVNH